MQKPILRADLKPYLKSLERRRKASPTGSIWALLPARWETLQAHARRLVADRDAGEPMSKWEHLAAVELVRIASQVSAEDAWRTACAVFMLQAWDPRRFVSDRAFLFQLGRQVRHLAEANRGSFYDPATGRVKFAYRDPNPRVAELIGEWLTGAFGVAGVHFAGMDKEEADRARLEREAFHGALDATATLGNLQCR